MIGPDIVTDSLEFYVDAANSKSYPGAGNAWYDLSGKGYDGTMYGTTAHNSTDGCMEFDGSSLCYVNFGEGITWNTNFTVLAWYRSTSANAGRIFQNRGTGGADEYAGFQFSTTSTSVWNNTYITATDGSYRTINAPTTNAFDGNWHQLAMGADISDGTTKMFYDAVSVYTDAYGAFVGKDFTPSGRPLTIGADHLGTSQILNGSVSVAMVYKKLLDVAEVEQNFNAIRGRYGI